MNILKCSKYMCKGFSSISRQMISPAARRLIGIHKIEHTFEGRVVTKEMIINYLSQNSQSNSNPDQPQKPLSSHTDTEANNTNTTHNDTSISSGKIIAHSYLRKTIDLTNLPTSLSFASQLSRYNAIGNDQRDLIEEFMVNVARKVLMRFEDLHIIVDGQGNVSKCKDREVRVSRSAEDSGFTVMRYFLINVGFGITMGLMLLKRDWSCRRFYL